MADDSRFRTISRDYPDGTSLIAVRDTAEPSEATDEEVLDQLEECMNERRLRAVDDPE